jgi:hypothetical protein
MNVGSSELYGNTTSVQSINANTQMTGNTTNGSFTGSASLQ